MTAAATIDVERAWRAVTARDSDADGDFVFAVTSTGVYCRPSCPARRPKRENVRFYAAPAEAESAGYRECRRCRPKSGGSGRDLIEHARSLIDASEATLSLGELSRALGVSASYLQRRFKGATGFSPREYAAARRIEALKSSLRAGDDVTTAIYVAGYGSPSRVYEKSDALLGMTPASYRRGGRGLSIGYSVAESPIGMLLMAATERGVCFVSLGDDVEELEIALRREYPQATVARAYDELQPALDAVLALINGGEIAPLAMDLRGTAFQMLVWKALQAIPAGETRTYQEIARAVGRPSASRAVAGACARNPVALIVPCHRAVRADGDAGGYRWGPERKRALLERERAGIRPC